jgi:hypothetical protein
VPSGGTKAITIVPLLNPGDELRIECTGGMGNTSVVSKINGSAVLTWVDTSKTPILTGRPGIATGLSAPETGKGISTSFWEGCTF